MTGKASTRERILEAAPTVLRRLPLSRFAMDEVAREAGIARQTIYKHFSGKEDLLVAMFIREMLEHHAPRLEEVICADPSAQALTEILMTEVRLARGYPLFHELLDPAVAPKMAELNFNSPLLMRTRERIWLPIIARYTTSGVLRHGLDAAAAVRWLTYQEYWLLTHPSVLCQDDETLRIYLREFVVGALLAR